MSPSEMRRWLDGRNIRLTKSLGQNFLHDEHQLDRIVAAGRLSPDDQVLEIGPGLGPLTERLLGCGVPVVAVEKDARLVDVLLERFGNHPGLRLIQADALAWVREHPADWSSWKLIANLPYSIASPLLVELAGLERCPRRIVVTLQLEVARRLMAAAGDEDYGVLSLLVQLRYRPGELFRIPPGCFFPEPEVHSACVTLERREPELLDGSQYAGFSRLVKQAFSQRRKMMMKLLRQSWPAERLASAYAALGLDEKIRAERVRLEQFVALTKILTARHGT